MTAFEAALKSTLQQVDEGFRAAEADLSREVSAANTAIQGVTASRVTMELQRRSDGAWGVIYELRLVYSKSYFEAAGFSIQRKGYPIRVGRSAAALSSGLYEAELPDAAALAQYFIGLASNPDSPLVLHIAYLMRRGTSIMQGAGE